MSAALDNLGSARGPRADFGGPPKCSNFVKQRDIESQRSSLSRAGFARTRAARAPQK